MSMIVNGFCKEVFKRAADGVRGRGPEAAERQPGRRGRLIARPFNPISAEPRRRA
ncbi:MAG: hypothetical protein MZV65_11225 [Chromatiales bacterium]|nr:hypothetical protein [Chromatiales bacterium]